ncbi:hypothetical protein B4098_1954 [Heyndrickxia coagulans]|uniref:Uncharacterized protein n=1 Tax=Heyndrickxia coagulans TaxID=1398 RepID=A0A150JVT8_HEYCO|nr:hypothetical protein B4098_1954 [Heyndrickxia coagulans]
MQRFLVIIIVENNQVWLFLLAMEGLKQFLITYKKLLKFLLTL